MANELITKINDDIEIVGKFEKLASQLKKLPSMSKYSESDILMIIFKGRELQMSPLEAIEQIYLINGRPCMSAQAMNSRIRQLGHSVKVSKWDEKTCIVVGKRKDSGDEMSCTYSLDDAKRAGLLGRQNWQNHPKSMLYARAISQLARSLFPDCLYCVYTQDELECIDDDSENGTIEIDPLIFDYEIKFLENLLKDHEDKKQRLFEYFGIESFEQITRSQWPDVMESANRMIDNLKDNNGS